MDDDPNLTEEDTDMTNTYLTIGTFIVVSIAITIVSNGCAAQEAARGAQNLANPTISERTFTSQVAQGNEALLDPSKATLQAPANFQAKFETTKGDFVIQVTRANAPNGADRFYNMVKSGYFQDIAIFRAIAGFMFQFGIHGTPQIAQAWGDATIPDDKFAGISNKPGTISFAQTGRPNSRSSQMFINLGDNAFLDTQAVPFVPFGQVISGMEVVKKINTEYGENRGNVQGEFRNGGNAYIRGKFPRIDFIKKVTILGE